MILDHYQYPGDVSLLYYIHILYTYTIYIYYLTQRQSFQYHIWSYLRVLWFRRCCWTWWCIVFTHNNNNEYLFSAFWSNSKRYINICCSFFSHKLLSGWIFEPISSCREHISHRFSILQQTIPFILLIQSFQNSYQN